MKIALLGPYDFSIPGGVRNHIIGLSKALRDHGNTVTILGAASCNQVASKIPDFIKICDFPTASRFSIAPHMRVNPFAISSLRKIIQQNKFDILHIHEPLIPPLCLSSLFAEQIPIFGTFHTYYEKGQPLYRLFQPILSKLLQRLSGRISVSESAKNYIARYFPYDYKIIPNGIDIAQFETKIPRLRDKTSHQFNLLFVGHQKFKRKGLKYLLDAYRILKTDYPCLQLTIVGATWFGASDAANSKELEPFKDISFLGMVSDAQLIHLYQTADAVCIPSIGRESFGIVLLEAMAAGIPVISTTIDGYSAVMQHEREGLLVPPKNSLALAEAIKRLIDNPTLQDHLIAHGKLTVQQYNWNKIARDVMDYYLEKL